MSEINNTLNERGERYGKFKDVASTTYALQEILRDAKSYKHMSDDQVIALDMICNKMARIVNGDPSYLDNWHDISGYATLVEQELSAASCEKSIDDDTHIENHISPNCKVGVK